MHISLLCVTLQVLHSPLWENNQVFEGKEVMKNF